LNGEAFSFLNFGEGQPDNSRNEDQLEMWGTLGKWNDVKATYTEGYICEWDKLIKNYTNMITADTNNDGINEFVLIGNDSVVNKVVSIDSQNKTVISEVNFSAYPTYSGISLSVVDDMNNNGKAEFSLLLTKKSDGSSVIETRDSGTGELLESYAVPR
jgi:hypothetical protein